MRLELWVVALGIAAAGCGGPDHGHAVNPRSGLADGPDACAAGNTRLGGTCWTASGTRWEVFADGPAGDYVFEMDLLAAGRARVTDHPRATPGRDEWFQTGALLRIFLSGRFVEYRARITNGTVLVGEAINVRGQRWSWRARRVFAEQSCAPDEALFEEGCLTLAGTRWSMPSGDTPRVVDFLDDGLVATGPGDAEGSWEQHGTSLRFRLEATGPTYEAQLTSPQELTATLEGRSDPIVAARIPDIPPIVHE